MHRQVELFIDAWWAAQCDPPPVQQAEEFWPALVRKIWIKNFGLNKYAELLLSYLLTINGFRTC
jgi:hypothetical protein